PAVCFARAEEFYWDDSQQDPVSFVVMLAIPKDKRAQGAHIEMLSAISLLFLEDDLRALWKETDSPQVVYESIVEALKKQAQ
ncbi:MAG: PTS sugar transporter subunit IIA, partial [Firmicutes bacterium]|nr:PTS sugar transporter subunit IIA [Bacillota bacterium]